jgi:hypothetical protein
MSSGDEATKHDEPLPSLRQALDEFVATIDATGGIKRDRKGCPVPAIDEEWIDLAYAYLTACQALGREPQWANDDDGVRS